VSIGSFNSLYWVHATINTTLNSGGY